MALPDKSLKPGWGIDLEKKKIIEDAAARYLRGEGLPNIAKLYGMNVPNLNKILKLRCGDTWEQHFVSKPLNIDEIVITKVPRLLPEETIALIRQRSEANKTFTHGQIKHPYLLARMIFCECGVAIFGQANHLGKLYYRHPRDRGCKSFNSIPADLIEDAIIDDIFRMLGDSPRILQAAKDATPDLKELEDLKEGIERAEKELAKIAKAKSNLLMQVEQGNLEGEDIRERIAMHREREEALKSQIEVSKIKCATMPSKKDITRKAKWMLVLMRQFLSRPKHLGEMSFDDKRKLLQYAFSGKDAEGKRCGVYISRNEDGRWLYTIKGVFNDQGIMKEIVYEDVVKYDYKQSDYLAKEDKQDILCERNAHNRLCFYQR